MRHRIVPSFAAAVVCVVAFACRTTLELRDVVQFRVVETQNDGKTRLEISGLAFHSALAVERMDERRDGTDLLVTLSLVPAHEGISGSFRYTVDVPDGVTRVLFGDWRAQIWPER